MKKFILIFTLLISCCCAKAEISWRLLGGVGYGVANGAEEPLASVSVEASIGHNYSNWEFLPSFNIVSEGDFDGEGAVYGGLLAGYTIPIGYTKTIIPKIGFVVGAPYISGPAAGINFETYHFVMEVNAFVSADDCDPNGWVEYSPYELMFSVGYKF